MQNDSWTTIESDPGVFTELISLLGVRGVQVEELYSLDEDLFHSLGTETVYGLIFLFKWKGEKDTRSVAANYENDVFFAQQVINNACATQAILSVLFNRSDLGLGQDLEQLKEFIKDFPPDLKGLAIGNSEAVRLAHNSFSPPQPMLSDVSQESSKEDVFHFISYVPVGGSLYELDGLKEGPIKLCDCSQDDWLQKARSSIIDRVERNMNSEIHFNLMAVIKDRKEVYRTELQKLNRLEEEMKGAGTSTDGLERSWAAQRAQLQQQLDEEEYKAKFWKEENVRRKHNYLPFIFNFLKILAEKKQLETLISKARSTQT